MPDPSSISLSKEAISDENFINEIQNSVNSFQNLKSILCELLLLTETNPNAPIKTFSSTNNYKVKRNADKLLVQNNSQALYNLLLG